jgi:hypothetical protein
MRTAKPMAGKINLGDHALIFDDDVGGVLQGVVEIHPGDESGEIKNGIREAFRGKFGEAAEEKSEDQHGEKRLKDDPENSDGGLFIADFNVAPDEEIKEFAIGPELGEAEVEEAAGRSDVSDDGSGVARGRRDRGSGRRRRRRHHQQRLRQREREKNIV